MVALFRKKRITGWRRHKTIFDPGGGLRYIRPDFTFPREKLLVLVDGCFWHACPRCSRRPKTNRGYWGPKLRANIKRDATATTILKAAGWRVIRVWEHTLTGGPKEPAHVLSRIKRALVARSGKAR